MYEDQRPPEVKSPKRIKLMMILFSLLRKVGRMKQKEKTLRNGRSMILVKLLNKQRRKKMKEIRSNLKVPFQKV